MAAGTSERGRALPAKRLSWLALSFFSRSMYKAVASSDGCMRCFQLDLQQERKMGSRTPVVAFHSRCTPFPFSPMPARLNRSRLPFAQRQKSYPSAAARGPISDGLRPFSSSRNVTPRVDPLRQTTGLGLKSASWASSSINH
jgi:hypothetical protein